MKIQKFTVFTGFSVHISQLQSFWLNRVINFKIFIHVADLLNECFLSELHTATQVYYSSAATLAR